MMLRSASKHHGNAILSTNGERTAGRERRFFPILKVN
jgi:hypothetical protein